MNTPEDNSVTNNRRQHPRWTVYNFLRATAVVYESTSESQAGDGSKGLLWTGLLVDVSNQGAQIILPKGCESNLKEGQKITICIKTSLENTDAQLIAIIKSIHATENQNAVRINAEFFELDKNTKAKVKIHQLCEYIDKLQAVEVSWAEMNA